MRDAIGRIEVYAIRVPSWRMNDHNQRICLLYREQRQGRREKCDFNRSESLRIMTGRPLKTALLF